MRKTALIAPIVALLALGTLTACDPPAPGGPGDPSPTTSTSADPSASPSDEPAVSTTADHIRVSTVLIGIMDDTDTAYEAIHDGVTAEVAVPLLTAAFGSEPVVSHQDGGIESDGGTVYNWSGFNFIAWDHPANFPPYNNWAVRVDVPAVNGIPIYAGTAIQVGDPMSEATAEEFDHTEFSGTFYQSHLGRVNLDPASVGEDPSIDTYEFLVVRSDSPTGHVLSIVSHQPSWGV